MHPREAVDELLQEHRAGDGARLAGRAHVLDVGDVGVDVLAIHGRQRQLPYGFAGDGGRVLHLLHQRRVVAKNSSDAVAERDDLCAGQRGDVDDSVGLLLRCQR